MEIALSKYASNGAEDIVTTISFEDEIIRYQKGFAMPCNWATHRDAEVAYIKLIEEASGLDHVGPERGRLQSIRERSGRIRKQAKVFYNHMKPADIRQKLGEEKFSKAFKISIVRNPLEQVVSMVLWRLRNQRRPWEKVLGKTMSRTIRKRFNIRNDARSGLFATAVDNLLSQGPINHDHYFLDGQDACNYYLRFENLNADLEEVSRIANIDLTENFPKTKHKHRTDKQPATELLTPEQISKCHDVYRSEFDRFGYSLDQ
ncbi:MAG: sulfotransferase family 2 domain-containing protein [Deltaproteobacteria bacterium]|nr:sulfotransferase family 2 domain-containing protein [Deltaproteobacteria bacterium]